MKHIITPSFTNLYKTFLISLVLTSCLLYGIGAKYPFFWEDAFIGMRVSKNFIEGKGLYHNWEEKVQTNTSVLYPLISAPLHALPYPYCLYAVQFFDVLLLALACYFSFLLITQNKEIIWESLGSVRWYMLLVLSAFYPIKFLFCSTTIISFGMETQMYILSIILVAYLYSRQKIAASFVLAGLVIYIRIEGALVLLVLSLIYAYDTYNKNKNLISTIITILPLVFIGFLIVVSYFGFVYMYYGDGMLHTVRVKKLMSSVSGGLKNVADGYIIPYRYSPALINIALVIGFIFVKIRHNIIFLIFWLLLYFLLFTFTGAWLGYEWYFSPILVVVSFLVLFINFQLILSDKHFILEIIMLCFFCIVSLKNFKKFVGNAIYINTSYKTFEKNAVLFNLLTNNKSYYVTIEPLGFYGYFNPNCIFKDYPGLASKQSYNIIKVDGKIDMEEFHTNKNHVLLMDKINSHFLILNGAELMFLFKNSTDTTNFIKLCKLPSAEFYSTQTLIAKRSMLSDKEINKLKNRVKELGLTTN